MAIVQISKIQQRAGNLVDLPQLDNAEFGWATDENRLFIGRTGNTYADENIEVLTSYSNISFSQIDGSDGGNFNITAAQNGQILAYVSSTDTWENYSGNTSQLNGDKLQLGSVSNISMTGGAIGYVLQTDGTGNLSWTPQGTLYISILGLSNATPVVMTVNPATPYVNDAQVTITGVQGASNTIVNGQTFYVQLAVDYPTSGNVSLYNDPNAANAVAGTGLTYTNSPNAVATSSTAAGGSGNVGGADTSVQFNDSGVLQGNSNFTFNKTTTTLTVSAGNIVTGNVNANTSITANVLVSNINTGTAPLTVTSTTRVSNLNVSYANVSDYGAITNQTTGTYYPTFVSSNATGNYAFAANGAFSANIANGALIATTFVGALSGAATTAGTVTTAAQPNITSVGTLTTVTVSGNANVGNLGFGSGVITGTGNITAGNVIGKIAAGSNTITTTGNITGGNIIGIIAAGSNTISTTGNANVGNLGFGSGIITGTGNANVGNLNATTAVIASTLTSNVATGTAPLTVTSTTVVPNLYVSRSNVAEYSNVQTTGINSTWYPVFVNANTSANYQLASNISLSFNSSNGALYATTFVGNVSGNISGNLTVNGSNTQVLFNDSGVANATSGFTFNKSTGLVSITGNLVSGNANLGNAATANFFIGAGNNLSNIQGANVSGTVSSATTAGTVTTAAQPNITSVGTLTSLGVNGTITAVAFTANTGVFTGNGNGLSSLQASNITGQVANALVAGTVYTAAQPNITSVGTLTSLSVTGNITGGNLIGPQANGNSSVSIPAAAGNVNISVNGTSNVLVVTATGANIAGTLNATGNANVGNIGGNNAVFTTFTGSGSGLTAIPAGNLTGTIPSTVLGNSTFYIGTTAIAANRGSASQSLTGITSIDGYASTVSTAAQPNITSVGTLTSLGVSGAVTASTLVSNVATGTAPLTVTSTTLVGNLYVARANVSDYDVVSTVSTGNYYLGLWSAVTGNLQNGANSVYIANVANGSLAATTFVGALSGAATTAGTVTTAAQPNITSVGTLTSLAVTGNVTAGNLVGPHANGNSSVTIPAAAGNVNISVNGTANVLVVTATGANIAGTLNATGNANVGNIGATFGVFTNVSGNGSSLSSITGGNVTGQVGNALVAGTVYTAAQPNITSVSTSFTNLTFANAQTISGNNMTLTTGANTNAGTITGNWSLSTGSKLQATYADLAEYYEADKPYEPGTVLEFGGEKEVTLAEDGTTRVAGIVSTNPAYVMNSTCKGTHIVALALQGRVPCKVRGTIRKGDMLVSGGNGYARAMIHPYIGSVIGKSLENFEGEGVIEVAVGRL